MKKIVYIFLLVIAIVLIASRTTSQNALAENSKPTVLKETKADFNIPSSETTPKILFLLNNENGQPNWSPALWWSYKPHVNKEGC
jgi:cell division protein YceG involved in septum cleavage